jgi:putative salt-induced outer membrane protein YdiY
MHKLFIATGCLFAMAAVSFGDQILFKSGDRLQGKVLKVSAGKMTFDSKVAGAITLNMADIQTFSTDDPIELVTTNGVSAVLKISDDNQGQIKIQELADGAVARTISIDDVAAINPEKVKVGWKSSIVGSAIATRGNTHSDAASLSAETIRRGEDDRITLSGGYNYANQRDNATREKTTTAKNVFAKGQYDYFFSEKMYGYGNAKYEKNRIANISRRMTYGVGLGYQWIEEPRVSIFTEAGLTYVDEKFPAPELEPPYPTGDGSWLLAVLTAPPKNREYMAARLAYRVNWTINDHVKFFHNFEYLPSLEDAAIFLINTDAGLRAELTARIFTEAKVMMAYNSKPSGDSDKKDMQYSLGIGVNF